jgi:hypothetical protein
MTPKEKAIELVEKFNNYCSYEWWEGNNGHKENMKQCALIAVDEIMEQLLKNLSNDISGIHAIYWEDVKQEIEKL